jgi:hypothetical protein
VSQSRQLAIDESAGERPVTGVSIDERTHYAHARYAAVENRVVIWYEPRDGIEILNLGVDTSGYCRISPHQGPFTTDGNQAGENRVSDPNDTSTDDAERSEVE